MEQIKIVLKGAEMPQTFYKGRNLIGKVYGKVCFCSFQQLNIFQFHVVFLIH